MGIIQYRRLLRESLEHFEQGTGRLPLFDADGQVAEIHGLMAVDTIAPVEKWRAVWPEIDRKRAERTMQEIQKLVKLKGQVIRYP